MSILKYDSLQRLYASTCGMCNGVQSVVGRDWASRECRCQKRGRQKLNLEKVNIRPNSLKYKDWADFNGTIEANGEIVGNLTLESALAGRDKAFQYCFGSPYDCNLLKNKSDHICIQKHKSDGQNVIITGDSGTGRSLLSVLILKEVIYAHSVFTDRFGYDWVEVYNLIDAARWTTSGNSSKGVDHEYLDNIADLNFLFLEGVGIQTRGHNYPPDHFALDRLFGNRRSMRLPTILTCSKELWMLVTGKNPRGREEVHKIYGNQFLEILRDSSNIVIDLERDNVE